MSVLPSSSLCARSMVTFVAIILVLFQGSCSAKHHRFCPPSSCGKIHNITYPFRLKGDPRGCGLPRYELDCVNNVTVLTLFSGKYHVQDINYKRYQIRLTDAGVVEDTICSIPRYFLNERIFSLDSVPLTYDDVHGNQQPPASVVFLNCTNPVTDDPRYVGECDSGGHIYAFLDPYNELQLMEIKVGCSVVVATFANLTGDTDRNVSYADIRMLLENGFWLSWFSQVTCRDRCGKNAECFLNETTEQVQCERPDVCLILNTKRVKCDIKSRILGYIQGYLKGIIDGKDV